MSDMIRVLLVDDHTVVRKGLNSLLSAEKYGIKVIGEAADGEQAVEKARELNPDVFLMDLMMPKLTGIEAIKLIKEETPDARILVLTSYAEGERLVQAIDHGALGFLLKYASPDELVSTIKNVYLDRLSLSMEMARKVMNRERTPEPKQVESLITEREKDVLLCIAQGYSNKQIAKELTVSVATVRTHVSSLLRKLDLENRTQLALFAREQDIQ